VAALAHAQTAPLPAAPKSFVDSASRNASAHGARAWKGLNYDLFVGAPIHKPEGFRTAGTTAGFNLNYSF
jgi:hemolysin activation/secretion protein